MRILTLRVWLWHWCPPVMWVAAILVLSGDFGSSAKTLGLIRWVVAFYPALFPDDLNLVHAFLRKVGHVSAYAILYLLCFRAVGLHLPGRPWSTCLAAAALSTLVALADEGCQSLVPSRHGSWADVLQDFSGITLAAGVVPGLWQPAGMDFPNLAPAPAPEKLGPEP